MRRSPARAIHEADLGLGRVADDDDALVCADDLDLLLRAGGGGGEGVGALRTRLVGVALVGLGGGGV
jgi:hypothetical protein